MTTIFGSVTLDIETKPVSFKPHSSKQTVGKRMAQHNIIGADNNDNIIDINGSHKAGTAADMQTWRNSLEDLNDGAKHAYTDSIDSRYDGDYAIETGSLRWEPTVNSRFIRFSLRLIEW